MASLTYLELSTALGITVGSAKNLVRRKRWMRSNGNDGAARIAVPDDYLTAHPRAGTDARTDIRTNPLQDAPPIPPQIPNELIETLRDQLTRMRDENDRLTRVNEALGAEVKSLIIHKAKLESVESENQALRSQVEWLSQPWIARLIKSLKP